MRYTDGPMVTAARSARGCGRCPTTVDGALGCRACTTSLTCCAPPPNTNRWAPITPPAASCAGTVSDPADVVAPVPESMRTTVDVVFCALSRPPATEIPPPSENATARESGDPSCQPARVATRCAVTAAGADGPRGVDALRSIEGFPWPVVPGRNA